MTRVSMMSMPGTDAGRSARVAGSVAASLRQGIWMMSFFTACEQRRLWSFRQNSQSAHELFDDAVPGDRRGDVMTRIAETSRAPAIGGGGVDGVRDLCGIGFADPAVDP